MTLPVGVRYRAMEAKPVDELPTGREWWYEPKWDGFRCLVFRDGDRISLMSKAGKPLARYFPDVASAIDALAPARFVLDGEIVVPSDGALSFDQLLQRIHPAASRVRMLAAEFPALLIVFDLLAVGATSLIDRPLARRRERLECFSPLRGTIATGPPVAVDAERGNCPAVVGRWSARSRRRGRQTE